MYFPPQDRIFQIEITTLCNLKCEGCSRTVGIKAGNWKNQHISVEDFRKAVAYARPSQAIILQGIGEPTLHPHLPELISIAKESGKFHTIAFYTNALARSMEYYDDLKARGHNLVTVSVDSLDQTIATVCREGTDVQKLFTRLCELYYTHSPNLNISLVLSRKNLFDSFETLKKLNFIASAGTEYITVFIQKMFATSSEIEKDFVLTPDEVSAFRQKMRVMKPLYKKLRIGLCGDLGIDDLQEAGMPPAENQMGTAAPTEPPAPDAMTGQIVAALTGATIAPKPLEGLCDKPYMDRFVTIDGYLTPCCVMTDDKHWEKTKLDRPLEDIFTTHLPVTDWLDHYKVFGHPNCKNCSIHSPLNAALMKALEEEIAQDSKKQAG